MVNKCEIFDYKFLKIKSGYKKKHAVENWEWVCLNIIFFYKLVEAQYPHTQTNTS